MQPCFTISTCPTHLCDAWKSLPRPVLTSHLVVSLAFTYIHCMLGLNKTEETKEENDRLTNVHMIHPLAPGFAAVCFCIIMLLPSECNACRWLDAS